MHVQLQCKAVVRRALPSYWNMRISSSQKVTIISSISMKRYSVNSVDDICKLTKSGWNPSAWLRSL